VLSTVVYEFLINNDRKSTSKTFQSKIVEQKFTCPFCLQFAVSTADLTLASIELIIKRHLTLAHFRLEFSIHQLNATSIKCTVRPNERFDPSMFNFSQEWAYSGVAKHRKRPVKHHVFELDPKSRSGNEALFVFFNSRLLRAARALAPEIDDDIEMLIETDSNVTPARVYFSSRTMLPKKRLADEEESSDDEREWLVDHQRHSLAELKSLSDEEKEFMTLWNEFVARHDHQENRCFARLCLLFVDAYIGRLISSHLTNRFLIHLASMAEHGVLRRNELIQTVDFFNFKQAEVLKIKI
jgi:hypothetical protein